MIYYTNYRTVLLGKYLYLKDLLHSGLPKKSGNYTLILASILLEFFKQVFILGIFVRTLIAADRVIFKKIPWPSLMNFFRNRRVFRISRILLVVLIIINIGVLIDGHVYVPDGPNVLLISIDTLRHDAIGVNSENNGNVTPNIDQFARRAINFKTCIAPSPWTLPSHMSMMTGLYPETHKSYKDDAMFLRTTFDPSLVMMAEVFRNQNYHTAAITGGGFVHSNYGFSQGFDSYQNGTKLDPIGYSYLLLKKFFTTNQNKKFFMFFHTYEVHAPYLHTTYLGRLKEEGAIDERQIQSIEEFIRTHRIITAEDLEKKLKELDIYNKQVTKSLYMAGVNYMDGYFGEIIRTLEELALLDNTIVILTSDHGEEFAEHNVESFYADHFHGLFQEHINVPFFIYLPGDHTYKGDTVSTPVSLVDIMPTLFSYLNIPLPERVQGRDVLYYVGENEPGLKRHVFASTHIFGTSMKAVQQDFQKYIKNYGDQFEPQNEALYNLAEDPFERNGMSGDSCRLCESFRHNLDQHVKITEKFLDIKSGTRERVNKDLLNELKSLGYLN